MPASQAAIYARTMLARRQVLGDYHTGAEESLALLAATAGRRGFAACELYEEHVPITRPFAVEFALAGGVECDVADATAGQKIA